MTNKASRLVYILGFICISGLLFACNKKEDTKLKNIEHTLHTNLDTFNTPEKANKECKKILADLSKVLNTSKETQ